MKDNKKYILTGYRAKGIKLYTPKYNNFKRFGLLALVVGCFCTPGTNWLLIVPKLINKYKPLWIFQ
jgi:hypothetical protein